jgi:hypothetical protein
VRLEPGEALASTRSGSACPRDAFTDNNVRDGHHPASDSITSVSAIGNVPLPTEPAELLTVCQIRHPSDPLFEKFLDILDEEFDDSIRDTEEDLERWLRDIDGTEDQLADDYILACKFVNDEKVGDNIAAALYASNYPTFGYLFINYIAINHKLADELHGRGEYRLESAIKRDAVRMLLKNLSEKSKWHKGVIAEIALDEKNTYLKRRFRRYASSFFQSKLYELDVGYLQPALDINSLTEPEIQDLIYMPGPSDINVVDKYHGKLPRDEAKKLINFIYDYMYAGIFDAIGRGEEYRSYIESVRQKVLKNIGEWVSLKQVQSRG